MFGSTLIKGAVTAIVDGLLRQLDKLSDHIRANETDKALKIVAEMKSALEKVRPWLARED